MSDATSSPLSSWDPTQYLRYGGERLRPALDLLARIESAAPRLVVDLGCGPGNVTAVLRRRWPAADILGVDGSTAMLARASKDVPDCRFELGDFGAWTSARPVDVIYSNAALHWLGGHETLFPRLFAQLAQGGVMAVQMPGMHAAPIRALQHEVAAHGPWAEKLRNVGAAPPVLDLPAYYDLLRPLAASVDLWETTYLHQLQGEDAAVQWAMGTSLRPFLDPLEEPLRTQFLNAYTDAVRPHYPRRPDGATLLPFRRLFLIATR